MWGWIKSAASSVGDFVERNKSAIVSTLATVVVGAVVGLAVGALIVATGGLAAGPIAAAMLAGGVAGAASGAAGYATKQWMDDKPIDGWVLTQQTLLGLGLGILTGGVGARALPLIQRSISTPLVESLAPEATTLAMRNRASAVVANGLIDAANAVPEKIVQNAANKHPWHDGLATAPLLGAASGVAKTLLKQAGREAWARAKGDEVPVSLPNKPRFTPTEDAATGQKLQGIALAGAAATGAAHVAGKTLELPTPPRPPRQDFPGAPGETAAESSATPALANAPAASAPPASPAPEPPRQGFVEALDQEGGAATPPSSPEPAPSPAAPTAPQTAPASTPAPRDARRSSAARALENTPLGE